MSKGLGEESRMSWRGSLSSKSITITWCIYPPGVLACLSSLCFQWPWAMWVYLLLLGGELLEGIEICQEGQLFLTAGAGLDPSFPSIFVLFFLSCTAVNWTMCWLDINELPFLSTPSLVYFHDHVLINHDSLLPYLCPTLWQRIICKEKENACVRYTIRVS